MSDSDDASLLEDVAGSDCAATSECAGTICTTGEPPTSPSALDSRGTTPDLPTGGLGSPLRTAGSPVPSLPATNPQASPPPLATASEPPARQTTPAEDKPTRLSTAQYSLVEGQRDALMSEVKHRAQVISVDYLLSMMPTVTAPEVQRVLEKLRREGLITRDGWWSEFPRTMTRKGRLSEPRAFEALVPIVKRVFKLAVTGTTPVGTPMTYRHRQDATPSTIHRSCHSRPDGFVILADEDEYWAHILCVAEFKKYKETKAIRDVRH